MDKFSSLLFGDLGGSDIRMADAGVANLRVDNVSSTVGAPLGLNPIYGSRLLEDFTDVQNWTVAATTNSISGNGGIANTATAAVDNEEAVLSKTELNFQFNSSQKIWFTSRIRCTEVAANSANIFVGLSDVVASPFLIDDGGGVNTTYVGAGFYKADGQSVWQFEASEGATKHQNLNAGSFADGEWQHLEFVYTPAGANGNFRVIVNGIESTQVNAPISGIGNDTRFIYVVKAGTAAIQAIEVDYLMGCSVR